MNIHLLTKKELLFLKKYEVDIDYVCDARGWDKHLTRDIMEYEGYELSWGRYSCRNEGHKLRTRADHCAQCNELALIYQRRHHKEGYIYIAESNPYIKIGVTTNIENRMESLNQQKYGGKANWKCVYSIMLEEPAKLETRVHNILSIFRVPGYYWKNDEIQQAREMFLYEAQAAIKLLKKIEI